MTNPTSNERSLKLLKLLVERYIREGQPVGSKSLAKDLVLSSATIRNIMADLEHAGYIHAPHTSAGRVPTDSGYRLFVDDLLTVKPVNPKLIDQYRTQLDVHQDANGLVQSASTLLSQLTDLAGVVSTPNKNKAHLKQIEFLPLSDKRILTVLVFKNRDIQNRIIYTDKKYTKRELELAGQFVNEHCVGKDLFTARKTLLASLQKDQTHLNAAMQTMLSIADQAFDGEAPANDYVFSGESNLLDCAADAGIDRLRSLFETFTQKQTVLGLLDKSLQAEGMQVFIGKESGYDVFDDWSIVTAPYQLNGEVIGVLGVVGPTRMAYDKVISTVDITAKLLSAALSDA